MTHPYGPSPIPARHNLQPERTSLAWHRTAIVALGALFPPLLIDARLGAQRLVIAGLVATLIAMTLVLRVLIRITQLRDDHQQHSPWWPMLGLLGVVVLAAAGGVGTAVLLLAEARY